MSPDNKPSASWLSFALGRGLPILILIALALGAALGAVWPAAARNVEILGTIFVRLLKMVVAPLVLSSVALGVAGLAKHHSVGRLASRTLLAFVGTTLAAITVGLTMATFIQPGAGLDLPLPTGSDAEGKTFTEIVLQIVPDNVFAAFANANTLGIIFIAVLIGAAVATLDKRGAAIVTGLEALDALAMRVTTWIMYLTPLGAFALMASTVANVGLGSLRQVGWYFICVLIGLALHAALVLPAVCWGLARQSPFKLLGHMLTPLATGFSTSSSAASMPVTIDSLTHEAGASKEVVGFVIPLGITINMDGTALYQAVAALFIAQAYGVQLGLAQLVAIAVTGTLASVATAGIPSAGLVTLVMILNAAGIPVDGIGLILAVDRLLDMCRTVVNLWGNMVVTATMNRVGAATW